MECSNCVLDRQTVPDLILNELGICQYCLDYKQKFDDFDRDEETKMIQLDQLISKIKASNSQYDCIMGLSGGVDSSFLALRAKDWGLNPLLVHFDNGWNSELAVENINLIIEFTGFDLHTEVVNWNEFRDLQRSYILADVLDWEVPTDHLFFVALMKQARKFGIKHIITGHNHQTEFILPKNLRFNKQDVTNIKDIHAKYGAMKLKNIKFLSPIQNHLLRKQLKFQVHNPLDILEYEKLKVKNEIIERVGWRDYGGKHYESIFTRFYQGYVLRKKFGLDKRRAHLSNLILSGQISKSEAIAELEENSYFESNYLQDLIYVAKKLGFSTEEFQDIINRKPKRHEDYKTYNYSKLRLLKKIEIFSEPSLYVNFLRKKLFH